MSDNNFLGIDYSQYNQTPALKEFRDQQLVIEPFKLHLLTLEMLSVVNLADYLNYRQKLESVPNYILEDYSKTLYTLERMLPQMRKHMVYIKKLINRKDDVKRLEKIFKSN